MHEDVVHAVGIGDGAQEIRRLRAERHKSPVKRNGDRRRRTARQPASKHAAMAVRLRAVARDADAFNGAAVEIADEHVDDAVRVARHEIGRCGAERREPAIRADDGLEAVAVAWRAVGRLRETGGLTQADPAIDDARKTAAAARCLERINPIPLGQQLGIQVSLNILLTVLYREFGSQMRLLHSSVLVVDLLLVASIASAQNPPPSIVPASTVLAPAGVAGDAFSRRLAASGNRMIVSANGVDRAGV